MQPLGRSTGSRIGHPREPRGARPTSHGELTRARPGQTDQGCVARSNAIDVVAARRRSWLLRAELPPSAREGEEGTYGTYDLTCVTSSTTRKGANAHGTNRKPHSSPNPPCSRWERPTLSTYARKHRRRQVALGKLCPACKAYTNVTIVSCAGW